MEGLGDKSHADKDQTVRVVSSYDYQKKDYFSPSDIKACYDNLDLASPSSFGGYFANLVKSKEILKNSSGYRLENKTREALDAQYGIE